MPPKRKPKKEQFPEPLTPLTGDLTPEARLYLKAEAQKRGYVYDSRGRPTKVKDVKEDTNG